MANAPFPVDPVLSGIAIAYHNARMIADDVLFRVPVAAEEFKYWKHDLAQGFTVPDTNVGRKSKPNEVEFSATEETKSTEDFGLDDPIPQSDVDKGRLAGFDPIQQAVEGISNLILLDREVRVANLVFDSANYAVGNKTALSGTDQFSDFAGSSPIEIINDYLDSMVMRGNSMTIGRQVYTKLSQHPDIVKAAHGNSGDKGRATRAAIAEIFELDEVFVGEARVNTARKGQPASLQRCWGKHISLQYRDTTANARTGTTFGYTAVHGPRIAGSNPDPDIGLKGGQRVRVGESVIEVITAPDLGFFIENAVA